MKTREIQCIHYICEGECDLGHKGIFYGCCQYCKRYKPLRSGKSARSDTRRKRKDREMKKKKFDY